MGLKDDLSKQVAEVFSTIWKERDGTVVPTDQSVKLGNDAVKLDATVLYADMADSTKLVDGHPPKFVAEIYKTFLHCAGKIIEQEAGAITAYDGDRVMAVFLGSPKNTPAVKAALKIKWAVEEIISPAMKKQYPNTGYELKHVVGVDTSSLLVAKTGVRGANDLVWVGRSANYAAKLSSLPATFTYITKQVYDGMLDEVKYTNGTSMWELVNWNTFDNRQIYRSQWRWIID
jgi:class 3 adenylate cyclase